MPAKYYEVFYDHYDPDFSYRGRDYDKNRPYDPANHRSRISLGYVAEEVLRPAIIGAFSDADDTVLVRYKEDGYTKACPLIAKPAPYHDGKKNMIAQEDILDKALTAARKAARARLENRASTFSTLVTA